MDDTADGAPQPLWRPHDHPPPPPGAPAARTWRHELYADYKSKRAPAPPELRDALPLVKELLDALALPWTVVPTVEADDVIATLVADAVASGISASVVSPDKDFQQVWHVTGCTMCLLQR